MNYQFSLQKKLQKLSPALFSLSFNNPNDYEPIFKIK